MIDVFMSSGDTIPNSENAIPSIFSTCNALCQGGLLLTLLDVPPSVCYPSGRRWQRRGPKPGEQRNLDLTSRSPKPPRSPKQIGRFAPRISAIVARRVVV